MTVPAGSVVRVIVGPLTHGDRLVDVVFAGKTLTMFVQDLRSRGEEIRNSQVLTWGRRPGAVLRGPDRQRGVPTT